MLNIKCNYNPIILQKKQINSGFEIKSAPLNYNCANNFEKTTKMLQIYKKPLNLSFSGDDFQINKTLSTKLNDAFSKRDASEVVQCVNKYLPTIKKDTEISAHSTKVLTKINNLNKKFPVSLIQINNINSSLNNSISVDRHGHIQITENGKKLFITKEELIKSNVMDKESAHIIGNGIRGFDPANQDDWVKTQVARVWPPSEDTRNKNGVATPFIDKSNKAVLFTSPDSVGKAYGVNPRGMVAINHDSSVIIAYQQNNNNREIDFSAWSIAPFKIPDGKKALVLFPNSSKEDTSKINNNPKWKIKDDIVLLDPSKKGNTAGFIGKKASWALFAVEGSDKAYLMRSIYSGNEFNNDIFKAFCLGGENTKYLEIEFMAPRVKQNEKSTIACKIEPIYLKDYGLEKFSAKDLENKIIKISKKIKI